MAFNFEQKIQERARSLADNYRKYSQTSLRQVFRDGGLQTKLLILGNQEKSDRNKNALF
jgi:hypothetical protein